VLISFVASYVSSLLAQQENIIREQRNIGK
jgi:hypothetical protein